MITPNLHSQLGFAPETGTTPQDFWGDAIVAARAQNSSFLVAQAKPEESHEAAKPAHDEHAAGEQHGDSHGEHHGESGGYRMPAEFPNISTLIESYGHDEAHHPEAHAFIFWSNPNWFVGPIFTVVYSAIFIIVIMKMMGKRSIESPSKAQVAVEALFTGLLKFFGEIIGPEHARKYVPYVGTLWLFILVNKLAGLIPGFVTPWAHVEAVAALGLCTFLWVNFNAIKLGGLRHYIWHLSGSPTNAIGWAMVILMLPLEIVGTLIKPVSLTLRLYGNTFGEEKLLASFLGLGMLLSSLFMGQTPIVGMPLHFPFMFLGVLTSVIQSTVFAMLAAVYIAMLIPHHHHDEHGHHEHKDSLVPEEVAEDEGYEVTPVA